MHGRSRATSCECADLDAFLLSLEGVLRELWWPLTIRRSDVEVVEVPTRILTPRRFDPILELRGVTWRRIQIAVSPDEAGIGEEFQSLQPPPSVGFGLPDPAVLVGIAMRFQIAQKLHAVSDPHDHARFVSRRGSPLAAGRRWLGAVLLHCVL
jgi:hypothetical protein